MDTGLKGKTVLITGATRNHGRASALAFAQEGANLLLCTRSSMDLLEGTADLAREAGVTVVTEQCDVTDEGQVNALIQRGVSKLGRVDVVVNNAGWRVRGNLESIDRQMWEDAVAVNVHAPFLMCKAVVPQMARQRWGPISISTAGSKAASTSAGTKSTLMIFFGRPRFQSCWWYSTMS